MGYYLIGVDIGGSKTEVALYEHRRGNYHLDLIHVLRTPTERQHGYEAIMNNVSRTIRDVCDSGVFEKVRAIGLGVPGAVDPLTHKMIRGNTSVLSGQSLREDLERRLGSSCPILVANDANCFALAEALCGAGLTVSKEIEKNSDEHVAVGVILGTGVGGGLIVKGRIWDGYHGGACEIGHLQIEPNGHPCYCGRQGCVEQYLSGPALEALMMSRSYSQIPNRITAQEVFAFAKQGDPIATAVVLHYKKYLARFLGNLVNVFDPHYFVLGGGLSNQEILYEGLSEMIQEHCFLSQFQPRVLRHGLSDSAGVLGAALLYLTQTRA